MVPGLKVSGVFTDYIKDFNPLMTAIQDLILQDPKMSRFNKYEVHIQSLLPHARKKLKENPQTQHVCEYFDHWDDFHLSVITMHANIWAKQPADLFIQFEDNILNIMACYLQRKIIFRPLYRTGRNDNPLSADQILPKVFQDKFKDTYYIFGVRAHITSFYVSAIPIDQKDGQKPFPKFYATGKGPMFITK